MTGRLRHIGRPGGICAWNLVWSWWVMVLALLASACGSSTETVTAPTNARCGLQAAVPTDAFAASGGTGTLRVTTSRECTWTARSDAAWLSFPAAASGQGDGSVPFAVAPNAEPTMRRAAISVNDVHVDVAQTGQPCEFDVASDGESVGPAGGERAIRVGASGSQCPWTASSGVPWITMLTTSATGTQEARFSVAASTSPRIGTITIAGRTITVTQASGCVVSASPSRIDAPVSGGSATISVSADPGCAWTASTSASWVTIASGAGGSGPGVVRLAVAPSAGPPRNATVRVGDQTVTVSQGYSCTFTIAPGGLDVPAAGGTSSLQMETQAGCDWTSASNAPWIVVAAGARGNGSGRIDLQIAANQGPSRTGTVTTAARAITVVQQDGCTFTLDRDRQSFPAAGGSSTVSVSGLAVCAWTASVNVPWIALTSSGGSGNGQVRFTVAANSGPAREGSIAIGHQTLLVQQASGCSYSVAPVDLTLPASGGSSAVTVTTEAGCPWTVSSAADWLSASSASGTGPVQLQVAAAPNLSPARTGTISVAGQSIAVAQPSQCTYILTPPTHVFGPDGGAGNILIIVSGPCSWTAVSTVDWIRLTAGAAGTGGGLIQFVAAPNPGSARTGVIRIAGQDYLVTEGGR